MSIRMRRRVARCPQLQLDTNLEVAELELASSGFATLELASDPGRRPAKRGHFRLCENRVVHKTSENTQRRVAEAREEDVIHSGLAIGPKVYILGSIQPSGQQVGH
jgi:hypothetical protein